MKPSEFMHLVENILIGKYGSLPKYGKYNEFHVGDKDCTASILSSCMAHEYVERFKGRMHAIYEWECKKATRFPQFSNPDELITLEPTIKTLYGVFSRRPPEFWIKTDAELEKVVEQSKSEDEWPDLIGAKIEEAVREIVNIKI